MDDSKTKLGPFRLIAKIPLIVHIIYYVNCVKNIVTNLQKEKKKLETRIFASKKIQLQYRIIFNERPFVSPIIENSLITLLDFNKNQRECTLSTQIGF